MTRSQPATWDLERPGTGCTPIEAPFYLKLLLYCVVQWLDYVLDEEQYSARCDVEDDFLRKKGVVSLRLFVEGTAREGGGGRGVVCGDWRDVPLTLTTDHDLKNSWDTRLSLLPDASSLREMMRAYQMEKVMRYPEPWGIYIYHF